MNKRLTKEQKQEIVRNLELLDLTPDILLKIKSKGCWLACYCMKYNLDNEKLLKFIDKHIYGKKK